MSITHLYEFQLDLTSNIPVAYPPYRTTPRERKVIEQEVQKLPKACKIHPSNSPYAAPCLVVSKMKCGNRLGYDYRGINELIRKTMATRGVAIVDGLLCNATRR